MSQTDVHDSEEQQYWCFISYRHADNETQDREWASWLQREIERYEVPAEIVATKNRRGDLIPERIYPVFRDEVSLPADADLASGIADALERSKFLLVLCSPKAVESRYVHQEIAHFKKLGKEDSIVAVIIGGNPGGDEGQQCFPKSLLHPLDDQGDLDTAILVEPVAADFRLKDGCEGFTSAQAYRLRLLGQKGGISKREIGELADSYESQLQLMKLKIIAGILGLPLEVLRDRDKDFQLESSKRRVRIQRRLAFGFALIAAVAMFAGLIAMDREKLSREAQHLSELESDALRARLLASEDGAQAQRDIATTLTTFHQSFPNEALPISLQSALASILDEARETARFQIEFKPTRSVLLKDGRTKAIVSRQLLQFFDLSQPIDSATNQTVYAICDSTSTRSITDLSAVGTGNQVALAFSDGTVEIREPNILEPIHSWTVYSDSAVRFVRYLSGLQLLLTVDSNCNMQLWTTAGDPVGSPYTPSNILPQSVAADASGSYIAVLGVGQREWHYITLDESGFTSSVQRSNNGIPNTIAVHPLGEAVAIGLGNGLVEVWKPNGTSKIFTGLAQPITAITYLESGRILAAGSEDGAIRLWTREGNPYLNSLDGHPGGIVGLEATPDRHFLASADDTGSIRVWDLLGLQIVPHLAAQKAHDFPLAGFGFGPTETELVTVDRKGGVTGWNWQTGDIARATNLSISYPLQGVVTHPARPLLAAFNAEDQLEILRTDSFETVASLSPLTKQSASERNTKGLVFHPELPWLYYTENNDILRIVREEDGWQPNSLTKLSGAAVHSLNWCDRKSAPLLLISSGEIRSFSESGELGSTSAVHGYRGFFGPTSAWIRNGEARVLMRHGPDGRNGINLLHLQAPNHRLLARSLVLNRSNNEALFQFNSKKPVAVSSSGEIVIFTDDDRLTPIFQSDRAHPYSVHNGGIRQLPDSNAVAVATSYDGVFVWATSPSRWEIALKNRLEQQIPPANHFDKILQLTSNVSESTSVAVSDPELSNTVVRIPSAGFQMAAHPEWLPIPVDGFNAITSLLERGFPYRGGHFHIAAAFRHEAIDTLESVGPFSNAIFIVDMPRIHHAEDFVVAASSHPDRFFRFADDAQFFKGLFQFERESLSAQWVPERNSARVEVMIDAVYKGDTPVRIMGLWLPTEGAMVALVAIAPLPQDGSEPPLFDEIRAQADTATIRPRNRVDAAVQQRIESEIQKLSAEFERNGAFMRWNDLFEKTTLPESTKALRAADDLVNLAKESLNGSDDEEDLLKWSITLIRSELRRSDVRRQHAGNSDSASAGSSVASSHRRDPALLADDLQRAKSLADRSAKIGVHRDQVIELLVSLYFRRIVQSGYPSGQSLVDLVESDIRDLLPLSHEIHGEVTEERFVRIALEVSALTADHPSLSPSARGILEAAIPHVQYPARESGIKLYYQLGILAAEEDNKKQAVRYLKTAEELSEQLWEANLKSTSVGFSVAEQLRNNAVQRFALEGFTAEVRRIIDHSIEILQSVSEIAPDVSTEVDRRIRVRRNLVRQWDKQD